MQIFKQTKERTSCCLLDFLAIHLAKPKEVILMVKGIEAIIINTHDPKKLSKFYVDVVGLKVKNEWEGEDGESAYEIETGNVPLYINSHSEIKGKNKEPQRTFINFEVGDIEKEVARLKKEKVTIKEDIYHVEGYGLIATFVDPDGNYFQFVQVRPSGNES